MGGKSRPFSSGPWVRRQSLIRSSQVSRGFALGRFKALRDPSDYRTRQCSYLFLCLMTISKVVFPCYFFMAELFPVERTKSFYRT